MKLAMWIRRAGVSRKAFAARIGVSPSYITALCDGSVWPGRDVVARIATATDGKVLPNDFMVAESRRRKKVMA